VGGRVMDLSGLVVGVGDIVRGWGEIRELRGDVWFDPPHSIPLIRFGPGQQTPLSEHAVRLIGHHPLAICSEFTDDGGIPGWATITGTWLGDAIRVHEQDPRPPLDLRRDNPARPPTMPPCPEPPGGWPAGTPDDILAYHLPDLVRSENCVATAFFRPRPDSTVVVIAVSDVAAAEQAWRPRLGARLGIVPSRWSTAELEAVTSTLDEHWDEWTISHSARLSDDHLQYKVETRLLRVTPAMARWAAALPDGIFDPRPTLTVVARPVPIGSPPQVPSAAVPPRSVPRSFSGFRRGSSRSRRR